MLAILKVIALSGVFFVSSTLAQTAECDVQGLVKLDMEQCGLALKEFQVTKDGYINLNESEAFKACGNCAVTLTASETDTKVLTSLENAQGSIESIFKACKMGYGTSQIVLGQNEVLTKVTLSHSHAAACGV